VEIFDSTIRGNRKLITTNGAGILFQDGRLVIDNSRIEENEGTAVRVVSYQPGSQGAKAILSGNVIQNNAGSEVSASSFGGTNAITMTDNLVQGNHTDGFGAGISINTRATLIGNSILDNRTSGNGSFKGGGVYLYGSEDSPILFQGNRVRGNTTGIASGGRGGGIYVEGVNVTLDRNIIQGNSANAGISDYSGSGGGLYVDGDVTLTNNIVTDNGVGGPNGRGAGITVAGAAPTLYHNTIARNTGGSGSGLYATYSGEPGLPVLYNTIIAEQAIGVEVNNASPQNLATLYGVLWWGNTSNTAGSAFAFDEVTGDPAFVDPDGLDYHIAPASAAIDVGRTDGGVAGDVDGEARPHYDGYDMGADEWWPLVAQKYVSADSAQAGDVVTYTLTLSNATRAEMVVSLADDLPEEVTYIGPLSYNYGAGSYAGGTVSWSGTVLTDTLVVISWPVQIGEGASGDITNLAAISDEYGDFNTNPATVRVPVVVDERTLYLPMIVR